MSGIATAEHWLPNPWLALQCRPDLLLAHDGIPEPARYYDGRRTIVLRKGMLVEEQRRHLFHELTHADRYDPSCYSSNAIERYVEREAARWAMPRSVLERVLPYVDDWSEAADVLKLPEEWVRFRWKIATRSEREHLIARALTVRES